METSTLRDTHTPTFTHLCRRTRGVYPFVFAVCLFCSVNSNHRTAAAAGAYMDSSPGTHQLLFSLLCPPSLSYFFPLRPQQHCKWFIIGLDRDTGFVLILADFLFLAFQSWTLHQLGLSRFWYYRFFQLKTYFAN